MDRTKKLKILKIQMSLKFHKKLNSWITFVSEAAVLIF